MKTFAAFHRLLFFGAALSLSSCAELRVARQAPFNESEFASYSGSGSGAVEGRLAVYSSNGMLHPAHDGNAEDRIEGTPITLVPVTAYTREIVDRELGDGLYLAPSDPRFKKYVRVATTDAEGNFVFHQIPAGQYFVAGEVKGDVTDDFSYRWAYERVTIRAGQTSRVMLSHNPQHGSSPVQSIWTLD